VFFQLVPPSGRYLFVWLSEETNIANFTMELNIALQSKHNKTAVKLIATSSDPKLRAIQLPKSSW